MPAVFRARAARVLVVMTFLASGALVGSAVRAVGDDLSAGATGTTTATSTPPPTDPSTPPSTDPTTPPVTDSTTTSTTTTTTAPPPVDPTSTTTTSTTTTSTTTTTTSTTTTSTTSTTTTTMPPKSSAAFDIGLIGDTGYNSGEDATLLRVRAQMAKYSLAFVTHDGDTKPQSMPCSDTRDKAVYNAFNGFSEPFVYTPGDNEWTDCKNALTRIASLRKIFFSTPNSLGVTKIPLTRQKTYVENARWTKGGVVFTTLDVPGPNSKSPSAGETSARHAANVAWLNAAFDQATATNAPAVMVIWQDDPFNGSADASLVATLKSRTIKFGKPVVLVHGDSHVFTLDHPWPTVPNFTRLETYGDGGTNHWVKATVDPYSPGVFTFTSVTS